MDQISINDIKTGRGFVPSTVPETNIRIAAGTRNTIKKTVKFARNVTVSTTFPTSAVVSRNVRVRYFVKQELHIPGEYMYNPTDLPTDTFNGEIMTLWPNPLQKITSGGTVNINTANFDTGPDSWLMSQTLMSKEERESVYAGVNGDAVYQPSGLTTARNVIGAMKALPVAEEAPDPVPEGVDEGQDDYLERQLTGEPSRKRKTAPPPPPRADRGNVRVSPASADVYKGTPYKRSGVGVHLEKLEMMEDTEMCQGISADDPNNPPLGDNRRAKLVTKQIFESSVNLAPLISGYKADQESGVLGVNLMRIAMTFDLEAMAAGAMSMPLSPVLEDETAQHFNKAWPVYHSFTISDLTFSFDYVHMDPLFNTITSGGSFFPYNELATFDGPPAQGFIQNGQISGRCSLTVTTPVVPSLILLYLQPVRNRLSVNKMQGLAATGTATGFKSLSISLGTGQDQQLAQLDWRDLMLISKRNAYKGAIVNQRVRLQSVQAQLGNGRERTDFQNSDTAEDGMEQQYPVMVIDPISDLDMDYGAANGLKNMAFGFEATVTAFGDEAVDEEQLPVKLRVGLVTEAHMASAALMFERVPAQFSGTTVANVYRTVQSGAQDIVL